ncbi:MAG: hypothetical protein FWH05_06885 [Oscillospiraceae bacterium]|nr:hypothetical protein [Oscillospiraceae bacterium]
MKPFDICIAYVSWKNTGKRRPVLLLSKENGYAEVFRITSRYDGKSDAIKARYFAINDWQQVGLAKPSYIDTMTPVEISENLISPPIGNLTENDKRRLLEFLNAVFEGRNQL